MSLKQLPHEDCSDWEPPATVNDRGRTRLQGLYTTYKPQHASKQPGRARYESLGISTMDIYY